MVKGMTILNVDDLVRCMNHNVEITARKFKKQAIFNRKVSLFSLLCTLCLYKVICNGRKCHFQMSQQFQVQT